ncbi:hypothetical protein PsorP6_007791 [Peronosclerospora sorghi]|uniref:Uncharacterized protein n=1 Tax=Peronosclerospora sorghi TaxID=230839 RepID=A0ACC0WA90_9STRA|nr:hypothetical protein PsorP6_007791 [Peronosclerospora sorghi]
MWGNVSARFPGGEGAVPYRGTWALGLGKKSGRLREQTLQERAKKLAKAKHVNLTIDEEEVEVKDSRGLKKILEWIDSKFKGRKNLRKPMQGRRRWTFALFHLNKHLSKLRFVTLGMLHADIRADI